MNHKIKEKQSKHINLAAAFDDETKRLFGTDEETIQINHHQLTINLKCISSNNFAGPF